MSKREVLSNDIETSPVLVELALADIHADEARNLRRYPATAKSVDELARDIVLRGQLQPVVVSRNGADGTQEYKLVAGFRRFAAIAKANEDGAELRVLARVVESDDKQAVLDNLAENMERESLSPIDMAVAIKTLRETQGMSSKEIARVFRKSDGWVRQVEPLLELTPERQKAVHKGDIPFGVARALSGLTEEEQGQVIEAVQLAIAAGESGQHAAEKVGKELRQAKGGGKRKSGKKSKEETKAGRTGVSAKAAILAFERGMEEITGQEAKTTKTQDRAVAALKLVTKFLSGKLGERALMNKLVEELG